MGFRPYRCPLSHPAHHPHNLIKLHGNAHASKYSRVCTTCKKKETEDGKFPCYICNTCDENFHEDCYKYPRKITHPYHLQHPLTLIHHHHRTGDIVFDKCDWCKSTLGEELYYLCSICNFALDHRCILKDPPLTITNPKCHQHQLSFIPRPLLLPCDACGLVKQGDPSYACFQCNYMVHQDCISLPRVIKITRHPHRLSHTPYLPLSSDPTLCQICYKRVDIKYGSYSCNHQEGCSYVVHSRCATHELVWDRKELEWEPEELYEDVEPFKKLSDGLIKYFSHDHPLKHEVEIVRAAEKQCEACVLPIDSGNFYSCMQCDFALHEVCAGLPRKLNHAMHKHTLVLTTSPEEEYNDMHCTACNRVYTGFTYKCYEKFCTRINIDFRCITMAQYLTHRSHKHPLFMATIYSDESEDQARCNSCKNKCISAHLQCTLCEYALCMYCATIPHEVFYKFDEHPLSLFYGEEGEDHTYWCEVCEGIINPTEWFYTCNKCCPTIHVVCLFGCNIYIKSGFSFDCEPTKVKTTRNGKATRPLCIICRNRCPGSIYFTIYYWYEVVVCSLYCLEATVRWYKDQDYEAEKRWLDRLEDERALEAKGSKPLLLEQGS